MTISLKADASGNSGAIQVSGNDKLIVNADGSLVATANPATGVRSKALATMQKFADEFGASLAGNGYQKLPSGLIIQWGSFFAAASDARTITLPVAYPTATLCCGHAHSLAASGYAPKAGFINLSLLQLGADFWAAGTNPTVMHYWFTIGY